MSFMFSKDLTRLSFANKNAHHFYRALAMRPLAPPRALRNPLRLPSISASPHQSFHASTPNQRNAKANKERLDFRNKAKKSGGFRVVEEEKESKLDVRLKNRERGSAVSSSIAINSVRTHPLYRLVKVMIRQAGCGKTQGTPIKDAMRCSEIQYWHAFNLS